MLTAEQGWPGAAKVGSQVLIVLEIAGDYHLMYTSPGCPVNTKGRR